MNLELSGYGGLACSLYVASLPIWCEIMLFLSVCMSPYESYIWKPSNTHHAPDVTRPIWCHSLAIKVNVTRGNRTSYPGFMCTMCFLCTSKGYRALYPVPNKETSPRLDSQTHRHILQFLWLTLHRMSVTSKILLCHWHIRYPLFCDGKKIYFTAVLTPCLLF